MEDRFRSITVRKSRYGESEIEVGCFFWGHNGYFKEIPKGEEIFDYSRYKHIKHIDKEETIPQEDNNTSNLNFTM